MTTAARSFNPFRTLVVHRNFRLFWFGQTTSLVGTWMQQVSTAWLALVLTNDAFLVGLVAAAGTLPMLLISVPAGVFADRRRKLSLVRALQTLSLVQATILWWFTWTNHMAIWGLIGLVLLSGLFEAMEIPARQSLIIRLVNRDDLQGAIALNSGGFNLARILGPSLAGVVIAQLGIAWCFGINALSYLAVIIALSMIRLAPGVDEPGPTPHSTWHGIREALGYVRGDRTTWILFRVVALFSFLGIPVLSMMPVVARDHLHLDARGYGVLMMSFGFGALTGALFIAGRAGHVPRGRFLTVSSLALGLAMLGFGLSPWPGVSAVMLFVCGLAMMGNNALINGLIQSRMPDAMRARVMALYVTVYIGMHPVGSAAAGWFARQYGVSATVAAMGSLLFLAAAWAFRRYPELRNA
ncbi:MAG TPA: MFS transporter [Gemmatimonadaceae bacterium]|nr:MFS transporter [Gemmatimonadaceae bacterium]